MSTQSLLDSASPASFGFKSGRALVVSRVLIGAFALLLAGGVAADWMVPSIRPGLSAAVGRDVSALLDSRSPGTRMAGAMLTKIKQALDSDTEHTTGATDRAPGGAERTTRSRMIPPRAQAIDGPVGLAGDDIQRLLGPLDGLGVAPSESGLTPISGGSTGSAPFALLGGGGGSGTVGGGGAVGGSPISNVGPTAAPLESPAAPVPEPSSWLMMVAGFGMAGAALRRRGRAVIAAALR